jgi:chemotaxis response regulator CheB
MERKGCPLPIICENMQKHMDGMAIKKTMIAAPVRIVVVRQCTEKQQEKAFFEVMELHLVLMNTK